MADAAEVVVGEPAESPVDKRGRSPGSKRGQFGHGRNPLTGASLLEPEADPAAVVVALEEGGLPVPPLLLDFRRVAYGAVNLKTRGLTPNQRAILKLHSENFDKFMTRFERMEQDFKLDVQARLKPVEEELKKGEAEEKIQRTIREILDRAKEGVG